MIKLRHLERRYPLVKEKFFYVLRDINLDIAECEFVSIMGPSGAGKSTLLHILGMHDHGWEGEYFLNDTAVHHLKPKERATLRNEQVGFVFQQYHLLDDLTVYEYREKFAMILDSFRQDVRVGLRVLFKDKSFCFLAVLVLGLGIGGATTQFTVVNAIVLRGLSFPHP